MIAPILLNKCAFGAFFLFGGLSLGTVAVLAYMPETRGRSLENIQDAFGRPGLESSKDIAHSAALVVRGKRPGARHGRSQVAEGTELAQPSVATGSGAVSHRLRVDLPS
ncbi:hypothetical protein GE09DRAFT_1088285 [Coniochaeta sp. 2T2.1]|nr:hypothetical protein GE09DRAFT_1088285 [Coniochaeta sp. 2T2.1]